MQSQILVRIWPDCCRKLWLLRRDCVNDHKVLWVLVHNAQGLAGRIFARL